MIRPDPNAELLALGPLTPSVLGFLTGTVLAAATPTGERVMTTIVHNGLPRLIDALAAPTFAATIDRRDALLLLFLLAPSLDRAISGRSTITGDANQLAREQGRALFDAITTAYRARILAPSEGAITS